MTNIDSLIDAIINNNPEAVSDNLSRLGVLVEGHYNQDYLKQVIVDELVYRGEEEGNNFLVNALNIEIDSNGPNAAFLEGLQNSKDKERKGIDFISDYTSKNELLVTVALVAVIAFCLFGIIYLIRKI